MNELYLKDLVKELRATRTARDRVDISLEKYEKMRDEIDTLSKENTWVTRGNEHLKAIMVKLGIPAEVIDKINPATVKVETYENPSDLTVKYNISFVVKQEDMRV